MESDGGFGGVDASCRFAVKCVAVVVQHNAFISGQCAIGDE